MRSIGLCISLTALLALPALADDQATGATAGEPAASQPGATQRFDFDDDQ
jgi:hypothetical protein